MGSQFAGNATFTNVARIIIQAEQAASIHELNEQFRGALQALGYRLFAYITVIEKESGRDIEPLFGEGFSEWSNQYRRMNLAQDDPIIAEAEATSKSFYWTDLLNRKQFCARARRVFEAARRLELCEGFVSPQRSMDGWVSLVLFAGHTVDRAHADARIVSELLAAQYHRHGKRLLLSCPGTRYKGLLTQRQTECLKWASRGKSSKDTAAILGISPCVVDEHMEKACDRLKVRTRGQAIYEAGRRGLDVNGP